MKIRMLTILAGPGGCLDAGAAADVPLAFARELVDRGFAEALEPFPAPEPTTGLDPEPPTAEAEAEAAPEPEPGPEAEGQAAADRQAADRPSKKKAK